MNCEEKFEALKDLADALRSGNRLKLEPLTMKERELVLSVFYKELLVEWGYNPSWSEHP